MPLVDYSTYFILSKKLEITLLFDSLLPATLTERSDVNNLMKGFSSHFQKFHGHWALLFLEMRQCKISQSKVYGKAN